MTFANGPLEWVREVSQGYALAPLQGDEVVSPEEFEKLPEEERKRIESVVETLQQELKEIVEQVPRWRKEAREKIKPYIRKKFPKALHPMLIDACFVPTRNTTSSSP